MTTYLKRRKWLIISVSIAVVLLTGAASYLLFHKVGKSTPTKTQQAASTTTKPTVPAIRFAAMGDMLAHDTIVQQAKSGSTYNFAPYFTEVKPLYKDADVVFCNPETIAAGESLGIAGYPTFNAPTEFARDLVHGAGCNVVNLASNHTNDKHQAGINANLDVWSKLPLLAYSGSNRSAEEQQQVHYFTKNGLKVAFLAFADYSNDTNLTTYGLDSYHDTALVDKLVGEARTNADIVLVSMHWGTEDSNTVNSDQKAATDHLAQLGVDVIIGTGPHVLQQATYVVGQGDHKTLVWYSIGNMLSSQLQLNELTGGVAGFTLTKEGTAITISDVSFKSTFMSYDWSAADKAAQNLLARHNLLLQPLPDANSNIQKMFTGESTATRSTYVHDTLTSEAVTSFTP